MQHLIESYSYKDADRISKFLLNYRDTVDYRYLFASKEWILSFLEIYKPQQNFLIQSKNGRNYFALSAFNSELVFTGDPFNDFNAVFTRDSEDQYDFKDIIKYFSDSGYKINWTNLFESGLLRGLSESSELKEGVVGLKIPNSGMTQSYDYLVSDRICRMYNRYSEGLEFCRIFGGDIKSNPNILKDLLSTRHNKLLERKKDEYNLSFDKEFGDFITRIVGFSSIWENVFIDYCAERNDGLVMAASLNFIKDKSTICYLRAHAESGSKISYGLILDYWSNSKNFNESVKIIDLTRGEESYKYRLGAIEYKLNNFVTI
jgi:hypothetical protein